MAARGTALVLSSGTVAFDLVGELGPISSGGVPLGGEPAISHVLRDLDGWNVVASLRAEDDLLAESVRRTAPSACLLAGDPSVGLGEACLTALDAIDLNGELLVVFGDTIVKAPPTPDVIVVSPTLDTERWTTAERDPTGRLVFRDKLTSDQPADACVGVFAFRDGVAFRESLRTSVNEDRPGAFFDAIERYDEQSGRSVELHRDVDWIDVGHLDTYFEARRRWLVSRHFNRVTYDESRRVIRKESEQRGKLASEIQWFQSLPSAMRKFAPRLIEWDEQAHSWYELEYVPSMTGADLFMHGRLDRGLWRRFFDAADTVLDAFRTDVAQQIAPEVAIAANRSMLVTKTIERVRSLSDRDDLALLWRGAELNGRRLAPLGEVLDRLERQAEELDLLGGRQLTRIHGDFFLGNILFDRRSGELRLVDPRGSYGFPGPYGDPIYDVAKLAHSFEGNYDFLVSGLYDLEVDGDSISFDVKTGPDQDVATAAFRRWLDRRADAADASVDAVRFVEMTLFLSMAPLHAEEPRRQLAFLVQGLQLHALLVGM